LEAKTTRQGVTIARVFTGITPPEKPFHLQFFADSCRQHGVENTLQLIPPPDREKYAAVIDQGKAFWDPGKVWGAWEGSVKACGLLDGHNDTF